MPKAKGEAIVDRTHECDPEDPEITVILPCGHKERFWMTGLSDAEYIRRTKILKKEEERGAL
jgi:hypothetical protein